MAKVDRNQRLLLELTKLPGNDVCADCRARNPRWAGWDHGVFLCTECAGLHRKMGTHVSKVKSLTFDTWTRDQVDNMKSKGNIKVNAFLNPDEGRNPPPTAMDDSDRQDKLERFIRNKYEYKEFVRPSPLSPSNASHSPTPPSSAVPPLPTRPPVSSNSTFTSAPTFLQPSQPPKPVRTASNSSILAIQPLNEVSIPPPSSTILAPTPTPTFSGNPLSQSTSSAKHVRFTPEPIPIPVPDPDDDEEEVELPPRVPSRQMGEVPHKGILRPRSTSASGMGGQVVVGGSTMLLNPFGVPYPTPSPLQQQYQQHNQQQRSVSAQAAFPPSFMHANSPSPSNHLHPSFNPNPNFTPSPFGNAFNPSPSASPLPNPSSTSLMGSTTKNQSINSLLLARSMPPPPPAPVPAPVPQPKDSFASIWDDLGSLSGAGAKKQQEDEEEDIFLPPTKLTQTKTGTPGLSFLGGGVPGRTGSAPLPPTTNGTPFFPSQPQAQQGGSPFAPSTSAGIQHPQPQGNAAFLSAQRTGGSPSPFQPSPQSQINGSAFLSAQRTGGSPSPFQPSSPLVAPQSTSMGGFNPSPSVSPSFLTSSTNSNLNSSSPFSASTNGNSLFPPSSIAPSSNGTGSAFRSSPSTLSGPGGLSPQPTGFQPPFSTSSSSSSPAPLQPQRTGFVPSSQFGQQLASESSSSSSSSPAIGLQPLQQQKTGFVPSSKFGQEQFGNSISSSPAPVFQQPLQQQKTGFMPSSSFGQQLLNESAGGGGWTPSSSTNNNMGSSTFNPSSSSSASSMLLPTTNPFQSASPSPFHSSSPAPPPPVPQSITGMGMGSSLNSNFNSMSLSGSSSAGPGGVARNPFAGMQGTNFGFAPAVQSPPVQMQTQGHDLFGMIYGNGNSSVNGTSGGSAAAGGGGGGNQNFWM